MSGNVMKTRRPEPAEVEYKQMRFLIMDRPTDATIDRFIEVGTGCDMSLVTWNSVFEILTRFDANLPAEHSEIHMYYLGSKQRC